MSIVDAGDYNDDHDYHDHEDSTRMTRTSLAFWTLSLQVLSKYSNAASGYDIEIIDHERSVLECSKCFANGIANVPSVHGPFGTGLACHGMSTSPLACRRPSWPVDRSFWHVNRFFLIKTRKLSHPLHLEKDEKGRKRNKEKWKADGIEKRSERKIEKD